jgi:hypothetical protein
MRSLRATSSAIVTLACSSWLVALPGASLNAAGAAQSGSQSESRKQAPKSVTLSGCVERDEQTADGFTLTDTKDQRKYRLSGLSVRKYLGSPVQVDGGIVVKGVRIKGGLLPNANLAGQAGAIDPAQAAIAAAGGTAPVGSIEVEEFKVKAIRPGTGSCP